MDASPLQPLQASDVGLFVKANKVAGPGRSAALLGLFPTRFVGLCKLQSFLGHCSSAGCVCVQSALASCRCALAGLQADAHADPAVPLGAVTGLGNDTRLQSGLLKAA